MHSLGVVAIPKDVKLEDVLGQYDVCAEKNFVTEIVAEDVRKECQKLVEELKNPDRGIQQELTDKMEADLAANNYDEILRGVYGYEKDEDGNYGHWGNDNGFFDYYEVGSHMNALLMKTDTPTEDIIQRLDGSAEYADALVKRSIDLKRMIEMNQKKRKEKYPHFVDVMNKLKQSYIDGWGKFRDDFYEAVSLGTDVGLDFMEKAKVSNKYRMLLQENNTLQPNELIAMYAEEQEEGMIRLAKCFNIRDYDGVSEITEEYYMHCSKKFNGLANVMLSAYLVIDDRVYEADAYEIEEWADKFTEIWNESIPDDYVVYIIDFHC